MLSLVDEGEFQKVFSSLKQHQNALDGQLLSNLNMYWFVSSSFLFNLSYFFVFPNPVKNNRKQINLQSQMAKICENFLFFI